MFFFAGRRPSFQPFGPAQIDWTHPLARGLVSYVNAATGTDLVRQGAPLRDAQASTGAVYSGYGTRAASRAGLVRNSAIGNSVLWLSKHDVDGPAVEPAFAIAGPMSMLSAFVLPAGGSYGTSKLSGWTTSGYALGLHYSSATPAVVYGTSGYVDLGSAGIGNGQQNVFGFTWDGTLAGYLNGVQRSSNTVAQASFTGLAGYDGIVMSQYAQVQAVWARKLTPAEVRAFTANPYCLLTRSAPLYIDDVAAAAGVWFTAAGIAQPSASANATVDVALYGLSVAVPSAAGSATADIELSGAAVAVTGAGAAAVAIVSISGADLARAAAQAGVSAEVMATAADVAQASGNAQLAAIIQAAAADQAHASGQADASATVAASASAAATAAGSAVLSVTVEVTAAAQAHPSAVAMIGGGTIIEASGADTAIASGQAAATVTVDVTAAGFVQAMAQGSLSVEIPISAIAIAQPSASARATVRTPRTRHSMRFSIERQSSMTCSLSRAARISAEVSRG